MSQDGAEFAIELTASGQPCTSALFSPHRPDPRRPMTPPGPLEPFLPIRNKCGIIFAQGVQRETLLSIGWKCLVPEYISPSSTLACHLAGLPQTHNDAVKTMLHLQQETWVGRDICDIWSAWRRVTCCVLSHPTGSCHFFMPIQGS